jgi:hypothetical protein
MTKLRSKAEYEWETKLQRESISRQINRIIADLNDAEDRALSGNAMNHHLPQQSLIDLAIRWGELCEMERRKSEYSEG